MQSVLLIFFLCLFQIFSIGMSDGIELFFNPTVHKLHNCPDIIGKSFNDYSFFDAFVSGVYCSWFLVLIEFIIFVLLNYFCSSKLNYKLLFYISLINIILPIFINPTTFEDIFLCHKILYLLNICVFLLIIFVK